MLPLTMVGFALLHAFASRAGKGVTWLTLMYCIVDRARSSEVGVGGVRRDRRLRRFQGQIGGADLPQGPRRRLTLPVRMEEASTALLG